MLQRRRYSKKGDGNATKKETFKNGGRKCYKKEDIPKRGTEMLKRKDNPKKGDGYATKKKIFQKGGWQRYKEEGLPISGT